MRKFIEKIHRKAHRLAEGKNPTHKFGYYDALVGIAIKEITDLKMELREFTKQVKYLRQSLEENDENSPRVLDLIQDPKLKEIAKGLK